MGKEKETNQFNKAHVIRLVIMVVIAVLLELVVFNFSTFRTFSLREISIINDNMEITADEEGVIRLQPVQIGDYVKNVSIDVSLTGVRSADVTLTLTDEGNKYSYDMPTFRVMPEVPSTGYVNIYPFGKVDTIYAEIKVPAGCGAVINRASVNVKRPIDIKPLRMLVVFLIILAFNYAWNYKKSAQIHDFSEVEGRKLTYTLISVAAIVILVLTGFFVSRSNEMIVSCPWPHHKQYQELARAFDRGSVSLDQMPVDERLLEVDNPYDTIALFAEGIEYNMDYAYYDGRYYVYFGIMPELLLYYPYYKLTGGDLTNYNAMFVLYIMLVIGVFLCIGEFIKMLWIKRGIVIPYPVYLMMAVGVSLLSNHVYMVGKADIYNIPVMMANAFTWLGISLWICAGNIKNNRVLQVVSILAGSLFMASVAGCRPQMLLYSLVAIPLFTISIVDKCKTRFNHHILFVSAFAIPYIVVAAIVCWYNWARFGSIFDFGAYYSLTTNDMLHRGFSLNRLLRGLYATYIQPAVYTHDFPYITSSIVNSNYMGRNIVEFTYGGALVTNILCLSVFAPLFGGWKKIDLRSRIAFVILIISSFIITCFDVNGAGIIYRYTCDMIPGLIMAAVIIWIYIFGAVDSGALSVKLFTVCIIVGLIYSFQVLLGPSGAPTLKTDSAYIYEVIRSYFRF